MKYGPSEQGIVEIKSVFIGVPQDQCRSGSVCSADVESASAFSARSADKLPTNQAVFVYCLSGIHSYIVWRILKQPGYQDRNPVVGHVVGCAMSSSKCKGVPALQHWKKALALEMFCLTPEGRVSKTGPGPGQPSKEIMLCLG